MTALIKRQVTLLAGMALLLGSAASARADYTFSFDGTVGGLTLTTSNSDQSNAIAQWMDKVIGGACATNLNCVSVTGVAGGGLGTGVAVDTTYTGDGHVVGPNGSAVTLGNTNNATSNSVTPGSTDNFLSNTANNASSLSTGIQITFSHGVSLTGTFSFDYEIFPDGTCSALTAAACGGAPTGGIYPNQPDLIFSANGSAPVSKTLYGYTPVSSGGTDGTSTKSSAMSTETAPQYIGTYTTTLNGATQLTFLDWPATIGVDNLKLVSTPEPRGGVFFLAGLVLAALVSTRLRRALAKS